MTSSSSTDDGGTVRVARLGRPHGLDGFLGLYVEPADLFHFEPGSMVWIDGSQLTVRAVRRAERGHRVAFEEITDRELAESIRGSEVYVSARRATEEGEYWPEDLIGLEARSQDGTKLGVVVGVVAGVAQDRLVVQTGAASFEVPFVDDLVPVVDREAGYLEIVPLPGLIEP